MRERTEDNFLQRERVYKTCNKCREKIQKSQRKKRMQAGSDIPQMIQNNVKQIGQGKPREAELSYPLSSMDLMRCLPSDWQETQIFKYNQLENFDDIDEMLGCTGCCFLLFESDRQGNTSIGHWTCLVQTHDDENNSSINFYDSYGTIPDDEKKKIDPIFLDLSDQSENTLSGLLYDASKTDSVIEYNEKPFQKMSREISTCGKHCLVRMYMKDLSMKDYQRFIERISKEYKKSPDELVNLWTGLIFEGETTPEDLIRILHELR